MADEKKDKDDELVEGEVKKAQKKGPRYERFYETDPRAFQVTKKKEPKK